MKPTRKRSIATLAVLALLSAACTSTGGEIDESTTTEPISSETTTTSAPEETTTTEPDAVPSPDSNPASCLDEVVEGVDYYPDKVTPEFTTQWTVDYHDTYKVVRVDITHGDPTTDPIYETYVLVNCGAEAPALEGELSDAFLFTVPLERFVETGGGTYGTIEMLGIADRVVGWRSAPSGLDYLPSLSDQADDIVEIGTYGEENYETLASLNADGLTTYQEPEFKSRARDLGIPTFEYHPFSEAPLGSAEQLKFMSLFFNAEERANELFEGIATTYQDLVAAVNEIEERPGVLIGNPNSSGDFTTRPTNRIESLLVLDAGGELLLDDSQMDFSGFLPTVSLETALAVGADAPYWFSMAYDPVEESATEFIAADPNNGRFEALCAGNAFHRFGRGEDYFATAAVRVDELLTDLVSIIHPDVVTDHELIHIDRITGDC